jgi:hypothetical protein
VGDISSHCLLYIMMEKKEYKQYYTLLLYFIILRHGKGCGPCGMTRLVFKPSVSSRKIYWEKLISTFFSLFSSRSGKKNLWTKTKTQRFNFLPDKERSSDFTLISITFPQNTQSEKMLQSPMHAQTLTNRVTGSKRETLTNCRG